MSNDIVTEIASIYENEILTEKKANIAKSETLEGADKLNKTDADSTKNVKKVVEKVKEIDATESTAKDKCKLTKENKENKGMGNESKFDQLFNKAKASILNEDEVAPVDPDAVVDTMDETDSDIPPVDSEEGAEDEVDIADALQEITDRLIEIVSELRGEDVEDVSEIPDVETDTISDEGSIGESVEGKPKPCKCGVSKLTGKGNKVGSVKQSGGKAKVPGMKSFSQKSGSGKYKKLMGKSNKAPTGQWGK